MLRPHVSKSAVIQEGAPWGCVTFFTPTPSCSVISSPLWCHSGVDDSCQPQSTDLITPLSSVQPALEDADRPSPRSPFPFLSLYLFFTPWCVSWVARLLGSYLKILRCSVACALNLSPSFMLGVLEWNPPGSRHRRWWALLLGVREVTGAACETPLGWLRRGRQLVVAQGPLPLSLAQWDPTDTQPQAHAIPTHFLLIAYLNKAIGTC